MNNYLIRFKNNKEIVISADSYDYDDGWLLFKVNNDYVFSVNEEETIFHGNLKYLTKKEDAHTIVDHSLISPHLKATDFRDALDGVIKRTRIRGDYP